ncbi:DapH/DapD/GlmU-related protein [Sulfurimonas marina]|nr:DapH/DapD/GlmU-related protein [Sulfurimonas marina]
MIKASIIAEFLAENLAGNDIEINEVASVDKLKNNAIAFSKKGFTNSTITALIIVPKNFVIPNDSSLSYIKVDNPRLSFAKIVTNFFQEKRKINIHETVIIGNNTEIAPTVSIGANCVIGNNVRIKANSVLNNNIIIADNTEIGENCYIKSGSIIGEDGFGFDFDGDIPIRIPHIGKVVIHDNVEIGSKNTIAKGTINDTIIFDNVKIDDQVHIAHNCEIGKGTIITACAEISGSVRIGMNCWIGPNCSIIQKVVIGDNVTIGIGTVITDNIANNKKIMGLESLELKPLIRLKKRINYGG